MDLEKDNFEEDNELSGLEEDDELAGEIGRASCRERV